LIGTLGAGAGAAAFLAACGGSDSNKNTASGTVSGGTAGTAAAKTPTVAASDVQTGGTLQYAGSRDVTTLDPHVGSLSEEVFVFAGMFHASLTYSEDSQLIPDLAARFEYPDNTTIVFTYRPGVQFHDGQPFTTQDAKASFDRYLAPATGSPGGASLAKKLSKIEVVDDKTIRVTLTQPDATALSSIGGVRFTSAAAIQKYGKDLARNVNGTGAYKLKEWLKDDHLTMERFDGYFNKDKAPVRVPRLDAFTFKPIVEPSVMLSNLKTRNIHIAGAVQPTDFGALKGESGINAVERKPSSSSRMYLNVHLAPTDDLRIRQAVNMAIDRDAIGKAVYFGLGQPARSIFSPTNWMYPKDRPPIKRDVAGAKAKIKEAGLEGNLKMDMILPASEPYRSIAQVLQASLAEAGITINIKQLESGQFLDALKAHQGNLALDAIGNRADPDGFFSGNFKADAPFNFAGFNDPEFEQALAQGLLLTDQEQRRVQYQKAEQRLLDQVPGIFLYNPPGLYATLTTVQEFKVIDFIGADYDATWLKKG
jgi:ABC-type transport system substrate-binding protein